MQSRYYEITDHQGNVSLVVTDMKLGQDIGSDGDADYCYAEEVQAREALRVLGAVWASKQRQMVGRVWIGESYRYGYNGKETDEEWSGDGGTYDYGFRIYDARMARFLRVDPLASEYPWNSCYLYAGNSPQSSIDKDGGAEEPVNYPVSLGGTGLWLSSNKGSSATIQSYPIIDSRGEVGQSFPEKAFQHRGLFFSVHCDPSGCRR